MPTTTKRKKNPVAVERDSKPFPFMAPDYPVKPWINAITEVRFMTVCFQRDDGTFAAFIAEDESVRAVGKTRREAEEKVKAMYTAAATSKRAANPRKTAEETELEEDLRIALSRPEKPSITLDELKRKYGF